MRMTKRIAAAGAVHILWPLIGAAGAAVSGAGPSPDIVVPDEPGIVETFAAGELRAYLARITGHDAGAVVRERDAGPRAGVRIFVGNTRHGRRLAGALAGADPEAFLVEGGDGTVALVGNSGRALLYAAYAFLEHQGCRWPAPGIDLVPRAAAIAMPRGRHLHTPGVRYRVLRFLSLSDSEHATRCLDWAVKNRINLVTDADLTPVFPAGIMKRGGVRGVNSTHVSGHVLTRELFAARPEIFARDEAGKAILSAHSQQFCLSEEGAASVYAERLREYIRAQPDVELLPITQADGARYCRCARCLKLYSDRTPYPEGHALARSPNVTRVWMTFVNRVAEAIGRVHPDKRFYTLAYGAASDPAVMDFPLHPSVVVVAVHSVSLFDQLHEYTRGLGENRFLEFYDRWRARTPGGVGVYDYYPFSKFRSLPLVAVEKVAADIRAVHERGCPYFELQSTTGPGMYLPVYYAAARVLWDPAVDLEGEMRLFYRGMYGGAAAKVEEFFRVLERARRAYPRPYDHGRTIAGVGVADVLSCLSASAVDEAEALLAAAVADADTAEARERLRPLSDHFRYAKHLRRGRDAYEQHLATGSVAHLEQAARHGDEILRLAAEIRSATGVRRELGMISEGIVRTGRSGVGDELALWRAPVDKAGRRARAR